MDSRRESTYNSECSDETSKQVHSFLSSISVSANSAFYSINCSPVLEVAKASPQNPNVLTIGF